MASTCLRTTTLPKGPQTVLKWFICPTPSTERFFEQVFRQVLAPAKTLQPYLYRPRSSSGSPFIE